MIFVLDTSVTMCWLLQDGREVDVAYAETVLDALATMSAVVPAIWALEVTNVVVNACEKKIVSQKRVDNFLTLLTQMSITEDGETRTHAFNETRAIAQKFKLSAYDASYLEIARRLNVPIATIDQALRKAAVKSGIEPFVYHQPAD